MIIYVIAGPPGVGKSTSAHMLIPSGTVILDQDLAGNQYKKQGFVDYQYIAQLTTSQAIKDNLFAQRDFALELNLGFQSHYDYLKSILRFAGSIRVHLLLFFTDDLTLCIDRAKIRHVNGGHEVKPEIIEEMYANTMPLFKANSSLFHTIRLVDSTSVTIYSYNKTSKELPTWIIENELQGYLPS